MCCSGEGDLTAYLNFACSVCNGNIGEAVEQEEKLCDEVKTVSVFTYLGDRVSVGGGF